jgi:hypothetical protein
MISGPDSGTTARLARLAQRSPAIRLMNEEEADGNIANRNRKAGKRRTRKRHRFRLNLVEN